ncbi:hypothetical protein Mal64_28550 [Pseudobythopirellula maris]|uniref:Uncharacterized protein n=1 Tax=Pseudobythopirellula maris TaxID=2527991 RepID=A0A5C5ZJU2_9BACT|nr:hypothetical protein [Pseudobythopirellula maris]TWT87317.1 hypothetical protein Mal64_28550 [Pseudobythopirellula maris]
MPAQSAIVAVLIHDHYNGQQTIRLPAEGFRDLHRSTNESLARMVSEHRQRYPQRPQHDQMHGR